VGPCQAETQRGYIGYDKLVSQLLLGIHVKESVARKRRACKMGPCQAEVS
jgi:hypothetical protein